MKAPCKDCQARYIACHCTCDKYKAFKENRNAYLKYMRNTDYHIQKGTHTSTMFRTHKKRWNNDFD